MDSVVVLKWHIRIYKVCGLWPPEQPSPLYFWYSVVFNILVNIVLPLSTISAVFFIDSIDLMVDHMVLTSTLIMVTIKSFNFIAKRKIFYEFLDILRELDKSVTPTEHRIHFVPAFRRADLLVKFFICNYYTNCLFIVLNALLAEPEHRMLPSTHLYPIKCLHYPIVLFGGTIFQIITTLFQAAIDIAFDTYGAAIIDVVNAHITVLGEHLTVMGHSSYPRSEQSFQQNKLVLVDLCNKYILILR